MQGRILKYIAAEEHWLRVLVEELKPILSQLHDHDLPHGKDTDAYVVSCHDVYIVS